MQKNAQKSPLPGPPPGPPPGKLRNVFFGVILTTPLAGPPQAFAEILSSRFFFSKFWEILGPPKWPFLTIFHHFLMIFIKNYLFLLNLAI